MDTPLPSDDEIARLASAADVAAAVERVYGDALTATGLIHAVAVRQRDRGRTSLLEAGDAVCRHASFAAGLARARADAILTSGEVLRRAPTSDHRLATSRHLAEALGDWRREQLSKTEAPVTLVVTAGEPDLEHPVFRNWTRPVVYTTRDTQWRLESRAADHGIEVVGVEAPTVEGAIDFLRRAFGAATLALEASPAACRELYGRPPAVDEVLLTVRHEIDPAGDGAPFLSAEQLARRFPERSAPYRLTAAGGDWSLQRWRR